MKYSLQRMKKKIAIILVTIILLTICVVLCGCNNNKSPNYTEAGQNLVAIEIGYMGIDYIIFYDRTTKVMYMFVKCGYSGCLTVMLDENGKPLLYEGE